MPIDTSRLRGRAVLRDPDEGHRAATNLELFFDLVFVVAIGRMAATLHHQLGAGHVGEALVGFAALFFGIWWSWVNFTWFSSAHDADDVPHRLLALVQMTGALVIAAGVTRAAEHDFAIVTYGYLIARVGLVWSWLRVARDQPEDRRRALRCAAGLAGLQILWLGRLLLQDASWWWLPFVVLVVGELAVPSWAEAAGDRPRFHAGHIEERYGLFVIILLGETILSSAGGFQTAFDAGGLTVELAAVGLGGLVSAFAMWWLYFDNPGHLAPDPGSVWRWAYAHVLVFAAIAATGAGVALEAEVLGGHGEGHRSERIAALAVAVPAAVYLVGLAVVILANGRRPAGVLTWPKLVGAAVIVGIGLVASVPVTAAASAAVLAGLTAAMVLIAPRAGDRPAG